MGFKRKIFPRKLKSGTELDNDLRTIGFNISSSKIAREPNIEDTLLSASIEAVNNKSGRIGGLLVDWLTEHRERINVDRLTKIVGMLDKNEFKFVIAFWSANAQRFSHDPRFKKLASLYKRERIDYIDRFKKKKEFKSTKLQIERNGEDDRFIGTCLSVPNKVFSHRPDQIFSASDIAKQHMGFRFRIIIGPSYRADMWACLRLDPNSSPFEVALKTYGSYPTAHQAKKDYHLVKRDYSGRYAS